MEEIILCSDNHGLRQPLEDLTQMYPITDYFIHCGDSEMHPYEMQGFVSVQGNNDYYNSFPLEKIVSIGEHQILVVHGHRHMIFGHYEMLAKYAISKGCDVVMFGHTHIPADVTSLGVRCLNPGSIWRNRDGSKPSYMVVQFHGKDIFVEKKEYELKKRVEK